MSEYIEREALIKELESVRLTRNSEPERWAVTVSLSRVCDAPAADVEPVVRAEWITSGKITKCSNCGNPAIYTMSGRLNTSTRCDLCGAHMERSGSGE